MKRVLMAVDESEGSRSVLSVFRSMVPEPDTVVLIHVLRPERTSFSVGTPIDSEIKPLEEPMDGPDHSGPLPGKTDEVVRSYRAEVEKCGTMRVKAFVKDGIPSEEILRAAREEKVDLIIMGRNGKRGLRRLLGGCVTKEVEKYATVPVVVAQAGGRGKIFQYGWRGAYAAQ